MTQQRTTQPETKRRKPKPYPQQQKPKPRPGPRIKGAPKRKAPTKQVEGLNRVQALAAARRQSTPYDRDLSESALTRVWYDAKMLAHEPSLQDLMWIEYRYMGPLARNERFAQAYIGAYRRAYARHFDPLDVEKKRPIPAKMAMCSPDEISALAHARATADALGVPYDLYCDTIMEGHLAGDKWQQPPRPNQMFQKLTGPRLRDRPSHLEIGDRLFGPDWDRRFFADAYCGDPNQEAALELLRRDVLAAVNPAARLAMYFHHRHAIKEDKARLLFDGSLVDRAISIGGAPPELRLRIERDLFQPSCFGFPSRGDDSPCHSCPIATHCTRFTDAVAGHLLAITGSTDPRRTRQRELATERKRRERERIRMSQPTKRAAKESASSNQQTVAHKMSVGEAELDDFLNDL